MSKPYEERIDQFLPNSDQCRYSLHLYFKQIEKLERAKRQLLGLITKTEVLLELALEREGQDE